jgi:hypothetical protein
MTTPVTEQQTDGPPYADLLVEAVSDLELAAEDRG